MVILAEQEIKMHANQILDPTFPQVLDPSLNTLEIKTIVVFPKVHCSTGSFHADFDFMPKKYYLGKFFERVERLKGHDSAIAQRSQRFDCF